MKGVGKFLLRTLTSQVTSRSWEPSLESDVMRNIRWCNACAFQTKEKHTQRVGGLGIPSTSNVLQVRASTYTHVSTYNLVFMIFFAAASTCAVITLPNTTLSTDATAVGTEVNITCETPLHFRVAGSSSVMTTCQQTLQWRPNVFEDECVEPGGFCFASYVHSDR